MAGTTRDECPNDSEGAAVYGTEKQNVTWLAASQAEEASRVLTRAFRDDPVAHYLFPDNTRRVRLLQWYLGSAARYCLPYGEVYTTEELDSVAAWLPPGKTRVSNYWHMFRSGMLLAPLKVRPATFFRLMALRAYTEVAHGRWAPERHWYLFVLGVEPSSQGRGVGGALMEPVLAQADTKNTPCYLETQFERNVPFYERQGFEVVDEGAVPNHGPRFWSMLRKPRK